MTKIDAKYFIGMIKSGYANLLNHAEEINTLNVFPVPDGDTGTNMSMTVENGYKEVLNCQSDDICDVAKAFSRGTLMGARGNSGVITSQIFRGFSQIAEGKKELSPKEVAEAFENGAKVAYKAIMKPVEGTILTVIREGAWYAKHDFENNPDIDIVTYLNNLYNHSLKSLENTPELLPVLKEVGVVDSGGAGLVKIFEGFKAYSEGNPFILQEIKQEVKELNPALLLENEEFGYCTEFILRLSKQYKDHFDEEILKKNLTKAGGESLVVVKDEDLVKVHVHMERPGEALNIGQRYGEFVKLKIENMQEQHSSIIANAKKQEEIEAKNYGVIAVASGDGVCELLKKCHCDIIVSGGQTMNPSTEDFVNEVKKLGKCKHVLIFPNNSNIILAAKQVADVFTDRNVHVVETKSIPACISCLSSFDPVGHLVDNLAEFDRILANVYEGSITYAIKDTSYEGVEVKQGDYIGIANKTIVSSSKNIMDTVKGMLDELIKQEDKEVLLVLTGEGSSKEVTDYIEKYVTDNSDIEVEVFEGNQPVYSYLFGLE